MNLQQMKVGTVYKNYKEFCKDLNLKETAGNSKVRQMKNCRRYFDYRIERQKIIITAIHNPPKPKIDNRSKGNNRIHELSNGDYEHILKYWDYTKNELSPEDVTITSIKEVFWLCNQCQHNWESSPYRAIKNNELRCPYCFLSKGAKRIFDFLKTHNINFDMEYTFNDLKGLKGNNLRFDFALISEDGKLMCLIEYDGEYHFNIVNDNHDSYEQIKEHDKRKDKYCLINDIKLIRIPYTHRNIIEEILSLEFSIKNHTLNLLSKSKSDIINYYEYKLKNFFIKRND